MIVASSCFPSLWFKSVLDFDFCARKNFKNIVGLKLFKNEEQAKSKLGMNYWKKKIVYALATDSDWQKLPSKSA